MQAETAIDLARSSMMAIHPELAEKFARLIELLVSQPRAEAVLLGAKAPQITADFIKKSAAKFASAREPCAPKAPATIPDEMVSIILEQYFNVPIGDLERVKREHALSMGAENIIGNLLEHYLANVLEPHGWIWCSGSMVKAADFVKPPVHTEEGWRLLQVKNRDNSENSSSRAIRSGTKIEKWHRTFSKKPGSNWNAFPDEALREQLSEVAFEAFVRNYLRNLPAA